MLEDSIPRKLVHYSSARKVIHYLTLTNEHNLKNLCNKFRNQQTYAFVNQN